LKEYDRARVDIEETCGAFVFEQTDVWANNGGVFKDKFTIDGVDEQLTSIKIIDLPLIHHFTCNNDN